MPRLQLERREGDKEQEPTYQGREESNTQQGEKTKILEERTKSSTVTKNSTVTFAELMLPWLQKQEERRKKETVEFMMDEREERISTEKRTETWDKEKIKLILMKARHE